MSYGPNAPDLFHRSADIVDKILRGAKPADIPVEQPTKFDLVINVTTAKALGLDVPPSDRGEDQRPTAQPEARVPQCLDKTAEGLEIHRVAVDAAAHQLAMGVRLTLLCRADELIEKMNGHGIPCPVSATHIRTLVEF